VLIDDARPLRLDDLSTHPRSVGFPPNHPPMRSFLGVPVITRGVAYGNLYLTDKQPSGSFTEEDEELVTLLAAQAAVAIENAGSVRRDALRRAVQAQEVERRRLARELHDETGQALTSILLGLKPLEEALAEHPARAALAELREHVVAALQDVRRLAVELRPAVLDDFGLVAALERLTEAFAEQTGIRVDFHSALGERRLPPEVETALYRVVQESLTNIVKHANARSVSISLARRDSAVAAVIEDDGAGFDPRLVREGGVGLLGMRERLALLDGRLEIESRPGAGTTLVAEVPLR
jgi:signal transduction histidine kinase